MKLSLLSLLACVIFIVSIGFAIYTWTLRNPLAAISWPQMVAAEVIICILLGFCLFGGRK